MKNSTLSINPYNNQTINTYEYVGTEAINKILINANTSGVNWRKTSVQERAIYLEKIANEIEKNIDDYAQIATNEMGKPISQSLAELHKSATTLKYYAEHATQFLAPQHIKTSHSKSYISFQPIGSVLAIMPWNFPYWQVFRVMGPILISGNTMILKHASNVMGCADAIQKIVDNAGLPEHIFQTAYISSQQTEQIISNPIIQAVTFTGSTEVGKQIAATAGKYIKKQVLELGGSDAYIVCKDADLDKAAYDLVHSRLNNAGQSCIGAKRFIIEEAIYDDFLAKIKTEMQHYTLGNPMDTECTLGPMSSIKQRDALHQQVMNSVAKGCTIEMGGYIPDLEGAFYPPTILTNITKDTPAYREEFFGPVALVFKVKNIDEAIALFNDTTFGLGGGIYSQDEDTATRIAETLLQAGSVNINSCVSSDPRMPFGGIKESGYGRELAHFGIYEFTNIKSIVL